MVKIMKLKTMFLSSAICLAINYSALAAQMFNVAVTDSNGGVVHSAQFGTCVTTSFTSSVNTCKEDVVKKIMMMDERVMLFDFDKYSLTNESKAKLDVMAEMFKDHEVKHVKIVGYTDRIGSDAYNDKLSKQRAHAVKKYLSSKVKLESMPVEVKGLGKSHQVEPCEGITDRSDLIACLAPNRRVELQVDYNSMTSKKK